LAKACGVGLLELGEILFLFGMVPITPRNLYKFAAVIDVVSVEISSDSE
jgi:hypothetical protein